MSEIGQKNAVQYFDVGMDFFLFAELCNALNIQGLGSGKFMIDTYWVLEYILWNRNHLWMNLVIYRNGILFAV